MGDWTIYRLDVDSASAGQRLDQWVAGQVPDLSRTLARKVIDLGGIHVNGRRVKQCSQPVRVDDKIEIYLDGRPLAPFRLLDSDILFRDDYLLAINKPAGVETQPTPARFKGTLYAALKTYLQNPSRPDLSPQLGMVQRLDRDTSGILVFSIHPRAHKGLTEAFVGRGVVKSYLALTAGAPCPPEGEIRSDLARSRRDNQVRSVSTGGKPAVTRYRVLAARPEAAMVAVEIETGRSHQIRAHFSEAGFPLAGDTRYGGPERILDTGIPRQMLHAHRLLLRHPVTQRKIELEAQLPADFRGVTEHLGLSADALIDHEPI